MKTKRKFSVEQKLEILREVEQFGLEQTLRKHSLARSVYYRWKSLFNNHGIDGLEAQYHKVDPQLRKLEKENERLRKIIGRMALELEVKSELLKKSQHL